MITRISLRKKIMITGSLLLLLAGLISGSTFATFTGETTNPANVFGSGTVMMTNVAGTAVSGTNCSTSTNNGTCATLFSAASTGFKPGGADSSNSVTITYTGTITTATFGVYATGYSSKAAGSSAACTAASPASKINLQIKQGSTIVYPTSGSYGTLADFAATYSGTGSLLHLKGGASGAGALNVWATNDASTFTINVNLDATADNTYQGCQSQADLVWYAAQ